MTASAGALPSFAVKPIGVIHTPFHESTGTPIQPIYAEGIEGWAEIQPEFAEGLTDLAGFERIWLIYPFDRAQRPRMVVTPYRDNRPHGIFATRAPCRPNPIGLSCVRLLAVENLVLRIADVDVLDGTPLWDIKPYVAAFDAFPKSRSGWFDASASRQTRADKRFQS